MFKRMARIIGIVAGVVACMALFFSVTYAMAPGNASLLGNWVNTDSATRGIVRIRITDVGGLKVHAYGACTPTACDWGQVDGTAYSKSVSDADGVAFTANYNPGFSKTTLVGYRVGDYMAVLYFTKFTDGSSRYDYYSMDWFRKAPIIFQP